VTEFEWLYHTYFNDVYRYILRLSGDEHIAEEITCDTFFRAMSAIDSFRGECDARVWLCQIAKNRYFTHRKKRRNIQSLDDKAICDIPDPTPDALEAIAHREEVARIKRIVEDLNEPYGDVFRWRVYGELSFRQIGQLYGKSDNWACVTYHRARAMIKERLEEPRNED